MGTQGLSAAGPRAALLAIILFLLWANIETPMWADDYCRAFSGAPLEAAAMAWDKYFNWTGRIAVEAITFVAMGTGFHLSMLPFDALNAAVFAGLIVLVLRLAALLSGGQVRGAADLLFAALLLWWGPRAVAEAALWKTGAINYLWAVAGELLILERALALLLRGSKPPPIWAAAPFALILATFLEPLSVVTTLALAVLAWRGRHLWLCAVALSHAAGSAVLLAAPGNFARAAIVAAAAPSPLADRLDGAFSSLGQMANPVMLAGLAVAAIPLLRTGPQALRAGRAWYGVLLALLYAACLIAVPRSQIAARVTYPGTVMLGCYMVALFLRRPPGWNRAVSGALIAGCVATAAIFVRDQAPIAAMDRGWTETLQHTPPGSDVVLPMILGRHGTNLASRHIFFTGFTADPANGFNRCYARAWGMASIAGR